MFTLDFFATMDIKMFALRIAREWIAFINPIHMSIFIRKTMVSILMLSVKR